MAIKYTEQYILNKLNNIPPLSIYKNRIVMYSGKAINSNIYYSEIISNYIINNINIFNIIEPVREKPYFLPGHLSGVVGINRENNDEENTVKRMVFGNYDLGELGMPVDFQVPLNQWQDGGRGKIDLLTFNKKTKSFYIVETKSITSGEQALRAILEVATYRKMIKEDNIINEYNCVLRDYYGNNIDRNTISPLKTAVLLFEGSVPANQIKANDSRGRKLRTLASKLNVQVFIIPPPGEPKRLKLDDETV